MNNGNIKYFSDEFLTKLNLENKEYKFDISSDKPLISVVMPSFNQAKYIERSILSVLNQDYSNKELIIIDGGSKDGTIEILKKYNEYIKYWISEEDKGQSDALNKGFKMCSGEIYCWLNSDDLFLPMAFSNAVIELSKKNKEICYGDWVYIDENDSVIDKYFAFDVNVNHLKYEGFHFSADSIFWHKSVHENFSGFDIKLNKTMDYQMLLEFALKQPSSAFIRTENVLGAFRRYPGQKTEGYNLEEHKEHQYLARKYNYSDKYSILGKLKRIFFRFRRAFWYFKRGGINELIKRILNWKIL